MWRSLISDFPDEPAHRHNLASTLGDFAWLTATSSDPAVRNFQAAFNIAQQAVGAEGAYHGRLGTTHYRAGKWLDAVAEFEKSSQLNKLNNGRDWLFLAMAQWQLGNRDRARTYYAQAVEWTETNKRQDDGLRRIRAEAAALLDIKAPPPSGTLTTESVTGKIKTDPD